MRPVLLLMVSVLVAGPAAAGSHGILRPKALPDLSKIDLGSGATFGSPSADGESSSGLMLAPPSAPQPGRISLPGFHVGPFRANILGSEDHIRTSSGPPGTKDTWGATIDPPRSARLTLTLPMH